MWRGVTGDLSDNFTTGDKFTWWALSSCTTKISVLESPQYVGTSGPRTMFSIETKSGKQIHEHSYFQSEDEILLPPGRYFQVIDKSQPAPNLYIIHLREIQPPFPMLSEPFDLSTLKHALPEPTLSSNASSSSENIDTSLITSSVPKPTVEEISETSKYILFYLN